MAPSLSNDFVCPNCGAEVHPNARACKKCAAPCSSLEPSVNQAKPPSWQQPDHLDGVDLPADPDNDPGFDYQEFIANEFGESDQTNPGDWKKVMWWLTAVILLIAFAYWSVGGW